MYVVAIIAGAGGSQRLGASVAKQWLEIGGRTMLARSVDAFDRSDSVDEILIVVPFEFSSQPVRNLVSVRKPARLVPGGPRRQDSVANGFDHLPDQADLVVVHDAARPLVTTALIDRTIQAAWEFGAAAAAVMAHDTIKQVNRSAALVVVDRTLARETIYLAQTPQAFRRTILSEGIALGRSGVEATDEAALVEQAGHRVCLVEGDPRNIKITTPDDLEYTRAYLEQPSPSRETRAGMGYDLHRLAEGRSLVLGGVPIPFDRGLVGHSDADVVCHAIIDALLGAARAGDIGRHFPDGDPDWKGASSLTLLARAATIVRAKGFAIENVDAVLIAERPPIRPYADRMSETLAGAMEIDATRVSVKGKTNEGVGEIGRGEAMAAHAVALLRRTL